MSANAIGATISAIVPGCKIAIPDEDDADAGLAVSEGTFLGMFKLSPRQES